MVDGHNCNYFTFQFYIWCSALKNRYMILLVVFVLGSEFYFLSRYMQLAIESRTGKLLLKTHNASPLEYLKVLLGH